MKRSVDFSFEQYPEYFLYPDQLKQELDTLIKSNDEKEVYLEIGSGNGHFLVQQSQIMPNALMLGSEIRKKRILRAARKSWHQQLDNLKWFFGDASELILSLEANTLTGTWLTFPEPWPKRKHQHHRIVNLDFLETLFIKTKENGFFTLYTDHHGYLAQSLYYIDLHAKWCYSQVPLYTLKEDPEHESLFEKRWRQKGKDIFQLTIQKSTLPFQ